MTIKTYDPAAIAVWESSLTERTELCLSVSGLNQAKLTLYAGPAGSTERGPVAIFNLPGLGTYVGAASDGNIESWLAAMLRAVKELVDPAESDRVRHRDHSLLLTQAEPPR
ncbi:hypothetical protein J2Y41_003930 [Arthrobacter sp. 1088]|uniref:hypothetical protein n=1 Tax=Arthrobacter sp. 1088 TaxID=2817768 RepID=UPI0028583689|nr:hypothetical protein [Arthrobacter sp. 1088]MDR6688344.1 hypothetical protein [Arthrobacter sp. 1088]